MCGGRFLAGRRALASQMRTFGELGIHFHGMGARQSGPTVLTATGRAMWQMIGALAELERSLIGERTCAWREGRKRPRSEIPVQAETLRAAVQPRKLIDGGQGREDVGRAPERRPHHPLPGTGGFLFCLIPP